MGTSEGERSLAERSAARELMSHDLRTRELARIVGTYPGLRVQSLSHPSCTEQIRHWVAQNDPDAYSRWKEIADSRTGDGQRDECAQPRGEKRPKSFTSQLQRTAQEKASEGSGQSSSANANRVVANRPKPARAIVKLVLSVLVAYWGYHAISDLMSVEAEVGGPAAGNLQAGGGSTDSAANLPMEKWVRPVAAGASSQRLVDTPSKNISCELHDEFVACSIAERYYADNGQEDCSEPLFSIRVDENSPYVVCGQEFLGVAGDYVYEMQYGEQVYWEHFACMAEEDGVSCWNQRTGAGFKFSRQGYIIF